MKYLVFFLIVTFNTISLYTQMQRNCGTKDPEFVPQLQYPDRVLLDEAICIPVVVHIIWNTAEQNISDSQILSQINVLNEDFRRMPNTPGFNNDQRGSDTRYEFRLANRDPQGYATNGITRHYSTQTTFNVLDTNDLSTIRSFSYWDRTRYFNIWVVPTLIAIFDGETYNILGYTCSFPWQIGNMDGIITRNTCFGDDVGTTTEPFHLGRTVTHEAGHYLGLLHTFQHDWINNIPVYCLNNDCNNQGDRVCDTPPCSTNFGCPTGRNSCNTDNPDLNDMIENYMDYTNDDCMNIFTLGQTDRMDANFWSYRADLATSNGLTNNDFIIFGEHEGNYDYNNTTRIVSQSNDPYSDFVIDGGNSVILRSREQIVLNPGFRASNGCFFRAFIDQNLPAFPKIPVTDLSMKYNADISIIPNPASDYIEINLGRWTPPSRWSPSGPDIKIYNTLGQCAMSESIQPMTSSHRLNISHLPSGVYFVRLISGGEAVTKQFVVVK